VRVPGEQIVLPEGTVPALIAPAVAALAARVIEQHRSSPLSNRLKNGEVYLLRGGLARCDSCGGPLPVRTRSNSREGSDKPTYNCTARTPGEPAGCASKACVNAEALCTHVWGTFARAASEPGAVEAALKSLDERREEEALSQLAALNSLLDENL